MKVQGFAHKYGDNIDTDAIVPARELYSSDAAHLAVHCMEDWDKDFQTRKKPGDIIVAGSNFGCGSSREHAPIAIKACGISAVVAKSYARIFYRNAINIGLPIFECDEAADGIAGGNEITIDFETGVITNITKGERYRAKAFPEFIGRIIDKGGLLASLKG